MDDVQAALAKVEAEIEALGAKLEKIEADVEAARAQHDLVEVAVLRTEKEQLRKKEEQLRKEKEQLRTKELLLLQRQPGRSHAGSEGGSPPEALISAQLAAIVEDRIAKQLDATAAIVEDRIAKQLDAKLEALHLNPWDEISSSHSSRLAKNYRSKVVEYYYGEKDALAQCMVCGTEAIGDKGVVAAHIWPRHTHGRDLEKFGLERNFVWDPRNSLLLLRTVESSFDLLRAGFFFDGHTFNFIVLDPALMSETVHETVKFSELHEKPLRLPDNTKSKSAFPCRRLLAWHFTQALAKALANNWQTEADLAKYFSLLGAKEKVDAWLEGVSPEAKWPGVRRAGQAALLAVRKASISSDDGEGDDEV